ncbi:hypothetical protein QYM36_016181, partial [Artemia franciscana]
FIVTLALKIVTRRWNGTRHIDAAKVSRYRLSDGKSISTKGKRGYSISGTVAGLVGGRVSDLYPHHTKWIVITCVSAMVIGNTQYMLGVSVLNVVMSRVVCGFGSGAGAALLAEICRTTNQKERTSVLSVCNGTRQLGILMGPACQLFLSLFDFKISNFQVNHLNAAGLFMALVWLTFFFLFLILYSDIYFEYKYEILRQQYNPEETPFGHSMYLSSVEEEKKKAKNKVEVANLGLEFTQPIYGSLRQISRNVSTEPDTQAPHSEDFSIMERDGSVADTSSDESDQPLLGVTPREWFLVSDVPTKPTHTHISYRMYFDEFLHDDIVVLFTINMFCFFAQLNVETVIAPILKFYFGMSTWMSSLVYMGGGMVSITVYITIAIVSRKVRDSVLLGIGCATLLAANIWFIVVVPSFKPGVAGDCTREERRVCSEKGKICQTAYGRNGILKYECVCQFPLIEKVETCKYGKVVSDNTYS